MRPRHLLRAPLALALALSEAVRRSYGDGPRRNPRVRDLDWAPGLSVVIPERGGAEMLALCLARLAEALGRVSEPHEVVVVVNGCEMGAYSKLREAFPEVRWVYETGPLGFTTAVLRGLREARLGAVYLLNNDMLLEPDALASLMPWRLPYVFGISSQIFFQEEGRRREETGWTFIEVENGQPRPRHEVPAGSTVRGTVYAGAGSAMYNASLLKRLLPGSLPFDPFYWEDTDMNVRAWRLGYEVLFCPASVAWHKHRATVSRYFAPEEVERVFERNRWLFKTRNLCPPEGFSELLRGVAGIDRKTLGEVGGLAGCWHTLAARTRASVAPFRKTGYAEMSAKYYTRPSAGSERPSVVLVSPYGVLPPAHGGAKRVQRLARELAKRMDITLLSDEIDSYTPECEPWLDSFSSVHLVGNRPPEPAGKAGDRIARIVSHSHGRLRTELARLIETRRPGAVLLEYMELGGLVDVRPAFRPPFILTLHDVLLQPDDPSKAEEDRYERGIMAKFDGLVASSKEDQALLGSLKSKLIPNGMDLPASHAPSAGRRDILFIGPFRAPINWFGIREFAEKSFPEIEAAVPGTRMTVVGGAGAKEMAAGVPGFSRPSIRVLEYVEDLGPLFAECALTINPQPELRGSSLKVLESLAAGRVCVSTRAGARGAISSGFKGLTVVDGLEGFSRAVVRLLLDEPHRLSIETPELEKLDEFSWEKAGRDLADYVEGITSGRVPTRSSRNQAG